MTIMSNRVPWLFRKLMTGTGAGCNVGMRQDFSSAVSQQVSTMVAVDDRTGTCKPAAWRTAGLQGPDDFRHIG
jgi:hypothetical protein